MVHIIGGIFGYIEPFIADFEHGCQGGGSYKSPLYEVEAILSTVYAAALADEFLQ